MPLPAFDIRGMLPPFTGTDPTVFANRSPYSCTMSELCASFGATGIRKTLLRNLIAYRALIASDGYLNGLQFVDGSFVEDIETTESRDPRDIDVFSILVPPAKYQADPAAWAATGLPFWASEIVDHAKNKARFSLDCYAMIPDFRNLGTLMQQSFYWYGLFSHKRLTQAWKGFVAVPLDVADDQVALTAIGGP